MRKKLQGANNHVVLLRSFDGVIDLLIGRKKSSEYFFAGEHSLKERFSGPVENSFRGQLFGKNTDDIFDGAVEVHVAWFEVARPISPLAALEPRQKQFEDFVHCATAVDFR